MDNRHVRGVWSAISPFLGGCTNNSIFGLWFGINKLVWQLHQERAQILFFSILLHPVLASSYPLWQDFSKRASFPIICVDWFYETGVRGVVKSWEFEGNLRCSKVLRIRRKNPMKRVLSISRDYCVYLDITLQSFKIWEFWGEFWGIKTFFSEENLVLRPA